MYQHDDELTPEEFKARRDSIEAMSKTNGWAEIRERLKFEHEFMLKSLLVIPAVAESLSEIARLQAQANGCLFVLEMVEDYAATAEGE
ncbi:MAG: hypothetical protein KBF73_10760 [Flavobacteriales bacterium]|nr:hypothetical protein [Flavobacteriales bacterium]